jgi:PAS domain S-box-containing protein
MERLADGLAVAGTARVVATKLTGRPPRSLDRRTVGDLSAQGLPAATAPLDPRVLAEQVRLLYVRAPIAQATVVVNAALVTWIFWDLVSRTRSLAWLAVMCALAALRIALVRAYRRAAPGPHEAGVWGRRFVAGAALTGVCWGAAALIFHAPRSPTHELFLAFVLGGMTAGAASSNASHAPAFLAYAAPAILPMVVRLAAEGDPIHAAMAFMLAVFGVAVAGLSRAGGQALEEALRLRFRNEALVEDLTAAQGRLERLNASLERRVGERTRDLERALALRAASETRLAVTLDSIGDALIATDSEGQVLLFNHVAETLTGWTATDAVHRPLEEVFHLLHEATRVPVEDLLGRVFGEGVVFAPGMCSLVARDGTERPISSTAAPIRDPDGEIVGAVLVFRDQTRERAVHDALLESDQRKAQFIAVLSHELRNPLAAIRSSLYLLERALPTDERSVRAREVIERQTRHLARLVDDLLDATRISQGKIELRRARLDARDVVQRACDDHRASFVERDVELRVETSGPVWVDADETRLAQVVGNLLHNAAKFSREGGTVVASVRATGGGAEIRVRDDGIGIAPDLLPRVFEPFVQADAGLARTKGGLGLGLALVKGLVELHGGSVHVRSDGVDRGAEFVLRLPLAPAPEVRAATPVPAPPRQAGAASVLVIEDNVDSARTIADVLAMEGHQVHVATDARSGIARARELRPDVILCDIGLPDMDGYVIARTLRAEERMRSTRLVALSGYAQPEDRRRAAEAGFDHHISKPAAIEALLAIVARRQT